MRGNAYLSRPVGSKEPPTHRPHRSMIAVKPVYIGTHAPTDHFASAARRFIPAEELYVPRKQRQKR